MNSSSRTSSFTRDVSSNPGQTRTISRSRNSNSSITITNSNDINNTSVAGPGNTSLHPSCSSSTDITPPKLPTTPTDQMMPDLTVVGSYHSPPLAPFAQQRCISIAPHGVSSTGSGSGSGNNDTINEELWPRFPPTPAVPSSPLQNLRSDAERAASRIAGVEVRARREANLTRNQREEEMRIQQQNQQKKNGGEQQR